MILKHHPDAGSVEALSHKHAPPLNAAGRPAHAIQFPGEAIISTKSPECSNLAAPPISPTRRRLVSLRRRWWGLARRLRPQLVTDRAQGPNAIAERVLGSTDELDQLDGQDGFFFVREIKVRHNPDMGWRSPNVPTRCSVVDDLIARWRWPRSFARRTAD